LQSPLVRPFFAERLPVNIGRLAKAHASTPEDRTTTEYESENCRIIAAA
jgi:hypothetical protein